MSEHEKTKDELPRRPRGPHPYLWGFVCQLDEEGHKKLSEKVREVNKRSESRPR
ncbi:hypothetical protein [Streptomyces sp. NPDC057115]|uniref:hypothetical protein n=1 Tax=Streptomyces sp. NPDC057115 TaxID=3346022 RepID=UPI00363AA476